MPNAMNPAAPHHLPPFITAPGETDYFYNGSVIFLIIMTITLGSVYFRLHALPEHIAHDNANKVQFQLVGVLALLALFTHNNIFWVAALLLALVRLPDIATPLVAMADSLAKLAGRGRLAGPVDEAGAPSKEEAVVAQLPQDVDAPNATGLRADGSGSRQAGGGTYHRDVVATVAAPAAGGAEELEAKPASETRPPAA